jgi:hypothetical protein
MFAFTALPGQATGKLQKLNSAQTVEQLGAKQSWLAHSSRMHGGFGNLIGSLHPSLEKQI